VAETLASFRFCGTIALMQSYPETTQSDADRNDGTHLWLVLWKAYHAVRTYAVGNIASLGVSLSDFAILEVLLNKGPAPVNEIGAKVLLTSGSITLAVDRLEAKGLVRREVQETDRRTRIVHLTDTGRELIEKAFGCHAAAMNRLSAVGSDLERAQLMEMLKRLGRLAEVLARG
jgi:MarR family 2-MHQ and catechol resistance regulon transcriptional repressor